MEDAPLNDRLDEFGTFVRHSFLQVHQILAMAPSMCPLRIARTLHDQPGRNFEVLARTIESVCINNSDFIINICYEQFAEQFVTNLPEWN